MQTFLTDKNPVVSAQNLDNKRLGKQRVEAIQIANILLNQTSTNAWRNHPAVKMWRGYEAFLIKVYLKAILNEWTKRGFKNTKCEEHFNRLLNFIKDKPITEPKWFSKDFFISHQSNLVRKNPSFYKSKFNVLENLEYIWPL